VQLDEGIVHTFVSTYVAVSTYNEKTDLDAEVVGHRFFPRQFAVNRSAHVYVDHGLGKGLRCFLGQIVPNATTD
jgi:hypothetical protein